MIGFRSALAICGLMLLMVAGSGTAAAAPLASTPQSVVASPAGGMYVVRPGENLSTIAQWVYGNANAWSCIWWANRWIGNPNYLQAGWRISLPASCSTGGGSPQGGGGAYVVQPGDNLSTIAWRHYGNAGAWSCVWAANGWIANPGYLQAGWRINLPASCGTGIGGGGYGSSGGYGSGWHTVMPGETLSGIACAYYADCNYWRIYNANRDRLWSMNYLLPGTVLRIP